MSFNRPGVMDMTFPKRKNDQMGVGLTVTLQDSVGCGPNIPQLLRLWRAVSQPPAESCTLFPDFHFAAAKEGSTVLSWSTPLRYNSYRQAPGLWFGDISGLDTEAFLEAFATKPGRSGGASAAANAGVNRESIMQQGGWWSTAVDFYLFPDDNRKVSFVDSILKKQKTSYPPTH